VQSPQGSFLRNREHILKPAVPINLPIQSPAFENQENIVNNTLQNDNTNNSQVTITIKSGLIIKKAIMCR
jgi:hypothetical protein